VYSGDLDARQKEAAKISFQEDPDVRVLVSTDAGGYGVDLPQANLLVNFDLPWSAGTAVQRNGRIRRASSRWPTVVIQDLLTDGSIEIRQHDLLQQKNSVAGAVVDGQGIDTRGGVQLGAGSLLGFLRGRV
jgi:superfamily II DNA/RNA helicase